MCVEIIYIIPYNSDIKPALLKRIIFCAIQTPHTSILECISKRLDVENSLDMSWKINGHIKAKMTKNITRRNFQN